jgi:hypothetical protein
MVDVIQNRSTPGPGGGRVGAADRARAGTGTILAYVLIPPLAGSFIAGLFLSDLSTVPWVAGIAILVGGVCFLLANPLARRSDGLRRAGYRRAAELVILVGFTAGAVVAYTFVVYLLIGFRRPWAAELLAPLFGG